MKMNLKSTIALFILCCASSLYGQVATTSQLLDVAATPALTTPVITLSWTAASDLTDVGGHTVLRRRMGEEAWATLTTTLPANAAGYADGTAEIALAYEYKVIRLHKHGTVIATGYLAVGADVPMTDDRGKLVLIVDQTMAAALPAEITQLQQDLAGDGWGVIRHDVPRMAVDPANTSTNVYAARAAELAHVKSLIVAEYNADPANVRAVYLLGRVPVPYAGLIAPDGHSDHFGAWPADGYYGDMDGVWTDSSVNHTLQSNGSPINGRQRNVPGDGKFDQSLFPGNGLELAVGRVDLSSMTKFPNTGTTEADLLARYLRRAHAYRHGQIWGNGRTVARRAGYINNNGAGWASFAGRGVAIGWSLVGRNSTAHVGAWFGTGSAVSSTDYLLAYAVGGGGPESMNNVATSADFGSQPSLAVFNGLFGSYFGDWDMPNNLLRAPLAGTPNSLGLASFWGGPQWFLYPMSLGETIGSSARFSMNNTTEGYPTALGSAGIHMALMGDPSLRLHVVLPPSNVRAQASPGAVDLTWEASPDSNVQGYHVYRGPTELGPFIRLTDGAINALSFTDTGAPDGQTYMVRALKRERGLGGRYHNLSQGAFTRTAPTSSAVTYHANGAESGTVPPAQDKIQGEALTLAANSGNLARAGFTFVGWNTRANGSGTDYAVGASYTADGAVTLYARWTNVTTWPVNYHANGATSGTVPAAQTKMSGVNLTIAGNSGSLIRDGHAFAGWNTNTSGTGTTYAPGASFNGGHGLALYARWTPLTYIVTYDGNGATSGTAPAQIKTHGLALTLPAAGGDLRKAGYILAGWNTQADGDGTNWDAGAAYTANAQITLYAQWTVSASTQTITATAGPNGSISPSGTVILNTGESQAFTITPDTGYIVTDVLVDGVSVGAVTGYTFPGVTADHTIAASFDVAPVTALAWGYNQYGKLGDGTTVNRGSPVNVLLDGEPMADVVAFASSFNHTAALRGDGRVLTWGRNNYGQLGNGTTTDRITPALLDGLTGVTAVSANYMDFTAALKDDGTVWAWGRGDRGELGNGTWTNSSVPVQADITGVTAIATGQGFTSALKDDGTVWAWGFNQSGQLGNGTTVNTNRPVQIAGLSGIVAISASANHGVALKHDGTVWVWGGTGGGAPTPYTPVQVVGISDVTAIAAGDYHVLALKADRTVWTWGYWNLNGQLGDGTAPPSRVSCYEPRPALITDVVAIAAGSDHSLAIRADGSAWAWGSDAYGQIGVGRTVWNSANFEPTPVQVIGSQHYFAIFAGFRSSFALQQPRNTLLVTYNANGATAGTVPVSQTKTPDEPLILSTNTGDLRKAGYTFTGWNTAANGGGTDYAAGAAYTANAAVTLYARWTVSASIQTITASAGADGSISPAGTVILNTGESQSFTITPDIGYQVADVRVDGVSVDSVTSYTFTNVTNDRTIAASFDTAPALAWGYNENGQLADGTSVNRGSPVTVLLDGRPMTDIVAFSSSLSHTVALRGDGRVLTWGRNNYGQLGDGSTTDRAAPALLEGLTGVTAVSATSMDFTAALKDDGTVWVWGRGDRGELGNGTDGDGNIATAPVQADITNVTAIATGQGFTAALKGDGTVWAWGLNASYQLGNGTTVNASRPVQIPVLSGIVAIAASAAHGVALKNDGTVWVWGGGGGALAPYTPVRVAAISSVTAIAAGDYHVLALKADGTVWAWGYHNFYGQFGDGTTSWSVNLYTPRAALISDVIAIAAGSDHSLAIKADGSAWAWGSDWNGQIGGGWPSDANVSTPMQALGNLRCIALFAGGNSSFALQQPRPAQAQTIAFDAIPDPIVTRTVTLAATASSGLPVSFVVTEGPAVLDGTSLSFTASGYVTVQATQDGNETFSPAAPVDRRFAVLTEEGIMDADGNGVDDRWEAEHWPEGTPPATVTKRGRAMSLRGVFVADLDPFDEDSVLEITHFGLTWTNEASHTVVTFAPASADRFYDLEASPHVTGGWQRVRGDIAPDAPSVRLETPTAGPHRFYRIQVRLPPVEASH